MQCEKSVHYKCRRYRTTAPTKRAGPPKSFTPQQCKAPYYKWSVKLWGLYYWNKIKLNHIRSRSSSLLQGRTGLSTNSINEKCEALTCERSSIK